MESHIHHPHGRNYHEEPHPHPHNAGLHPEGEDEHHHEKKSVIKKVKAKAKKIKETITKHGRGHDHEEGDDDDEEMVDDPEVHGASPFESAAVGSGITGPDVNLGKPVGNLETPFVMAEDRYDRSETADPPVRHLGHGQEGNTEQLRGKTGVPTLMEEDPNDPKVRPGAVPPPNYETKVTGPTSAGGEEVGITPILRSFNKMGIYDDQSEPKSIPQPEQKRYTGTHDQFSPELVPKSFDANKPEEPPRDTLTGKPSNQSSSYISAATSAIANKAAAAKEVVASKLVGYSGNETTGSHETVKSENGSKVAPTVTEKVKQKLAPVYEKVAGAGSSVISKVHGTGTGQQGVEKGPDKGVPAKYSWMEKFRPGDEDKALSEVITHAFHRGKGTHTSGEAKPSQDSEISQVISDAFQKLDEPAENKGGAKPTESGEEARMLGTSHEHSGDGGGAKVAGSGSSQKGVVDRLKGAVSSWLGKGGGESQTLLTTSATGEQQQLEESTN